LTLNTPQTFSIEDAIKGVGARVFDALAYLPPLPPQ